MKLRYFSRLTGRNLFADRSAVVGLVDMDEESVLPTSLHEISEALGAAYPDLAGCLDGLPDHPDKQLLLGDILSTATAAICNLVDPVSQPIEARRDEPTGAVYFGATCHDDRVAPRLELSFDIVSEVVAALYEDTESAGVFRSQLESLRDFIEMHTFGINALIILRSAEKRCIPWFRVRLGQDFSLAQLGWGRNARRINLTRGPGTSYHACVLSQDKSATGKVLARFGVPVPAQRVVETAADACRAALELGFPVVVKPLDSAGARGVAVGLQTEESVRQAFAEAARYSGEVLVETVLPGVDHRLLVVQGEFKAAARRDRASVVGNGKSTVRSLLEDFNRDPRRQADKLSVLKEVQFNNDVEQTLASQGLSIDEIPSDGETVYLRSSGNLSSGATPFDVTNDVHPDNRDAAAQAALAVGLDIAGIDFISPDISRSWREIGGGICEVNDLPGIGIHEVAEREFKRDYGGMILDAIFPAGDDARIPVAIIIGNKSGQIARQIAIRLQALDICTALLDETGISIAGKPVVDCSMSLANDVSICLEHPSAQAAVLALPLESVRTSGLGIDQAALTVLAGFEDADSDLLDLASDAGRYVLYLVDEKAAARIRTGNTLHLFGADKQALDLERELGSTEFLLCGEDGSFELQSLSDVEIEETDDGAADLNAAFCTAAARILAADHEERRGRWLGQR